ncbi:hypothetical protein MAP00_004197 [Monascus purpureus]|nr:hypothetical protein MAP00_004197 [Monascus purpureus]
MELDIDRKLGAVFGSFDGFIEPMLEIQENIMLRADFSQWADSLRFIEVPRINTPELDDFCRTKLLNLTNKGEFPGEKNYLAVSYCWDSFEVSDGTRACSPYKIRTDRGIRPIRAPSSVLERSVSCAITRGVRFVWIDQECIDQDDSNDLEQGIQYMDQVYQTATHSVGLLSTKFYAESTLRTFTRILSHIRNKSNRSDNSWQTSWHDPVDPQSLLDVNHFLFQISSDRWFRRNWTYQEASCTQGQMQLLIPHASGQQLLITDGSLNEVSLRLCELFDVVSVIRATVDKFLPQIPSGVKNIGMEAMSGLYVQAWEQHLRKTRPQSYEVASQMSYRDNSVVTDRLAITANLCDYSKIIDPSSLRLRQYTYSVCAFALALVNGAIIPSGRSNLFASTGKPIYRWQDLKIYDFIAFPKYISTHAHPGRVEQRFADVKIRREGLETSGWLWIVDRKIELRKEFTTDHYHMSHWFFDLLESLLERGYLWCGRLDGEEEPSSVFHCESTVTVFTGSATSFVNIPRPWMAQNFISSEVIPGARAADGVTELVHTMENINGAWYPVGNSSRRFLFPWGDQ